MKSYFLKLNPISSCTVNTFMCADNLIAMVIVVYIHVFFCCSSFDLLGGRL